jgi:hypothetical protein
MYTLVHNIESDICQILADWVGASRFDVLATLPIPDPPDWHEGEVGSYTLGSAQTIFIF